MAKTLIQPTLFNPTTREVTFPFTVDLARVYAILNATRGGIYYSIGDPTLIATAVGSVLTLNASVVTTGHLAGDEIAILYEGDDALTDAQLRATPVPVSGPATDAQLRATPLPVSGPATDAQLRATPLPVSQAGVSTETTLAAVLAKIIAAPATEATLAALNGKFGALTGGAAPVTELPLVVTGEAARTAIVNNILTVVAGASPTAVDGYRSGAVQVVSTATGGSFIFEQSLDNVNFVALPVFNAALTTGVPITAAITPTASSIIYTFPIRANFLRLRIVGTLTGGSVQAFTRLSTEPWTPSVFSVAQPTAGSLNATIGAALPAGANSIGTVALGAGAASVGTVILGAGSASVGTFQPGNTANTTPWLVISRSNIYFNDSTTPLGIAATLTGTARDTGIAAGTAQPFSRFNAFVLTDQAGTLRIEASNDNVTFRRASTDTSVVANVPLELTIRVSTRYHRLVLINGGVAQTILMANTSYTNA